MKTIIVPTDFSKHAEYALEFAMEIAPKMDYTVMLIHIIDLPSVINSIYLEGNTMDELNREATSRADQKLQQIRSKFNSERLHTAVFQGKMTEVIREVEQQYHGKLIIMGTKGASGLKEVVFGSNTEKTARHAHTPVISVPHPVGMSKIRKILVPTNGKDVHKGFFNSLRKLQQIFDAHIEVVFINTLHAFENEEELLKELDDYAREANLQEYSVAVQRAITPEDGIADYIDTHGIGMVAIATHGRQGFSHLMYGSLAENLINHLQVPVYSYNLKSKLTDE